MSRKYVTSLSQIKFGETYGNIRQGEVIITGLSKLWPCPCKTIGDSQTCPCSKDPLNVPVVTSLAYQYIGVMIPSGEERIFHNADPLVWDGEYQFWELERIVKTIIVRGKANDPLQVKLRGNPSTGYLWWNRKKPLPDNVELISEKFHVDRPKVVGSPGDCVLTFKSSKAGRYIFSYWYQRPWESDSSDNEEAQIMLVVVKE